MKYVLTNGDHIAALHIQRKVWDLVTMDGRFYVVTQVLGDPLTLGEEYTAVLRPHPMETQLQSTAPEACAHVHATWLAEALDKALKTISYTLTRTQSDPDFRHVAGPGTELFRKAIEAEAFAHGLEAGKLEERRSKMLVSAPRLYLSREEHAAEHANHEARMAAIF